MKGDEERLSWLGSSHTDGSLEASEHREQAER